MRRKVALGHDFHPPLEVRKIGWNRCAKPFWSENVIAVRLCNGCKERETLSVNLDRLDGLLIGEVCSPRLQQQNRHSL